MHHDTLRKRIFAVMALVLISLIGLWSFNALSELFGVPPAQFKHAVAIVGLLLIINWTRKILGHNHDCRDKDCGH